MEQVQRFCDFNVASKRAQEAKPHGALIEDGAATMFVLEGVSYEVDVCEEHRQTLRESLKPFIDIAKNAKPLPAVERNVRGRLVHRRGRATFTTKDVRVWAQERGIEVAPSGRLPKTLVEEYEASHSRN